MVSFDWMWRMTRALRAGARTAYATYKEDNFVPLEDYGFDDYAVRIARYWIFRLYADNTVFSSIEKFASTHKETRKLYKHIRSIYNPVNRLINLEVAKVYGGVIDYANQLSGGALPIVGADDTLIEALSQLFLWSNMGAMKNRLVRDGATYGDTAWKVIDDRAAQKVRLEVLDPAKIADVTLDAVGNVKAIRIEYLQWDAALKKEYLYTETIDGDSFRTFRDGEPFPFYTDASGQAVPAWDNEYGFVPVRLIKHRDSGGNVKFGTTSFNTSLSKIDEMNDLASNIHDAIRKNVNPLWAIAGNFTLPDNKKVTSPGEKRDENPFVRIPADSKPYPLLFALDIAGSLQVLDKMIGEVEKDMPQLALQRMRENLSGNVSGVTVKNLYGDASDQILETQGNYDAGTVAAAQMAITVGGLRRYRGFEVYNLGSYDAGALDFTIKPRSVFSDELSLKEKLDLTLQAADSPAVRVVMREMQYSEEDIDEVADTASDREAAATRGLMDAAFNGLQDNANDTTGADNGEAKASASVTSGQVEAGVERAPA